MTTEFQTADAALDAWIEDAPNETIPTSIVPKPRRPTVRNVLVATALLERVEMHDLLGPSHEFQFSHPRQLAMYVARSITGASYPQIGMIMGGRDHTTILFGCRKWFGRVLFNERDRQRAVMVARLATEIAEETAERSAAQMAWMRQAQANVALANPARQMVTA